MLAPCPQITTQLRAAEVLRQAEVVVYDDLGAEEALQYAPPTAERIYVGAQGNMLYGIFQQPLCSTQPPAHPCSLKMQL